MSLSGCVFFRLLQVKRQLADAEHHVRLETRGGLTLTFAEPILLPDDVLLVARRPPSRTQETGSEIHWTYAFIKEPRVGKPPGGPFDVPVDLCFSGGRLLYGRLPERFGKVLRPAFVLETVKAVGHAEVQASPKRVSGRIHPEDLDRSAVHRPSRKDILEIFGPPFKERMTGCERRLQYRYTLLPGSDKPQQRPSRASLTFTFRHPDGRLLLSEARFAGITLLLAWPE